MTLRWKKSSTSRYRLTKENGISADFLRCSKQLMSKTTQRLPSKFIELPQNFTKVSAVNCVSSTLLQGKTHPNVVNMLSNFVIETADSIHGCIIYELMQTDLKKVLDDKGNAARGLTVNRIVKQTLQGVSFLHKHGIVHADIKPENLLLDDEGTVKVCDIGSAVEVGKIESFRVGTVPYLAPELILGLHFDVKGRHLESSLFDIRA